MLIIFEGGENSGKTTLINSLMEDFRIDSDASRFGGHASLPDKFYRAMRCTRKSFKNFDPSKSHYDFNWDLTESALYDWRFWLESMENSIRDNVFIWDRSFITQKVYQKAIGPDSITPNHISILHSYEKHLADLEHMVFYCERDAKFKDDYGMIDEGNHKVILAEYDKWAKTNAHNLNITRVSNTSRTVGESASFIFGEICSRANGRAPLRKNT